MESALRRELLSVRGRYIGVTFFSEYVWDDYWERRREVPAYPIALGSGG